LRLAIQPESFPFEAQRNSSDEVAHRIFYGAPTHRDENGFLVNEMSNLVVRAVWSLLSAGIYDPAYSSIVNGRILP
jgi:hypothetical protein